MPHRLRKFPRVWALKTPLRRSYRRFFDFWTPNLPTTGNVNKPNRTGTNTAFHCFLFTFCEGKIGGSKGGYHEFVKFRKFSNCAPTYSTIPMRCGVHVVTKIYRCGGAVRACSRAIAVFSFFKPIFRLWATFTRRLDSLVDVERHLGGSP